MKKMLLTLACLCSLSISQPAAAAKFAWHKPMPIKQVTPREQICFTMYTLNNHTLKLFVQLYPLKKEDSRRIKLQARTGSGRWKTVAETNIRETPYGGRYNRKAWNALFRVENWDSSKEWDYRVTALDTAAVYTGKVRKDPVNKTEIVVAAFTGRSEYDRDPATGCIKPVTDIINNLKIQDPDLLFFSGDQVYHHQDHYACWLEFGEQFREIMRDRPTVCMPDDHDVGQGNLWGSGGTPVNNQNLGGYTHPAQYIKEVEFAQTSCLPDPYDPTPIEQGIGVHYTSLNIGGIDFAIIEDRKFKSGPLEIFPELKNQKRPDLPKNVKPENLDSKNAVLWGKRQLKFIDAWAKDWKNCTMKCILSPTILCQGHSGPLDLDTNGWPQNKRNEALRAIRKAFAFTIAGDQHLSTFIHYGVDQFGDSGYSFCVPSIVNHFPREWKPKWKPIRHTSDTCPDSGDYFDRFGNRITMLAHSTPGSFKIPYNKNNEWYLQSTGYGLVRFNKEKRTITSECWPRGADISKQNARQYPGWPITIKQEDNYARKATGYLPMLKINGLTNAVVAVFNEDDSETIYTIRINGNSYRPKVFKPGSYTVKISGGSGKKRILNGLTPADKPISINVDFK